MSPDGESIGRALRTAASHESATAQSGAPTTRRTVAQGLRHHGQPVTASALARELSLHANTVRNHLESLADDGLAHRTQVKSGGRGRPSTVYSPLAAGLLPLEELSEELSSALTSADAASLAHDAARAWHPQTRDTPTADDPDKAVDLAVEALRDVGFEASRNMIGDEITMTGCPYTSLIAEHPEICAIHTELVHNVLSASGQPVEVESVEVWARPGICRARLKRDDVGPSFTIPSAPSSTPREESR